MIKVNLLLFPFLPEVGLNNNSNSNNDNDYWIKC